MKDSGFKNIFSPFIMFSMSENYIDHDDEALIV